MRRPLALANVRLEDYDAVYLPGGHGPMADLAWDADVGRLLTAQLASGKPLFIVCHAPASLLATRIHGESPFKGYRVTGFTNEEEEAVGLAPGPRGCWRRTSRRRSAWTTAAARSGSPTWSRTATW